MGIDWLYETAKVIASPVLIPLEGLYTLGGVLNEATGGTTTTYDIHSALGGGAQGTEFSSAIAAVSAYDPGERMADGQWGGWQVPVVNPWTPRVVDDIGDTAKDLLIDIPPWVWALGAGGLYLALKGR